MASAPELDERLPKALDTFTCNLHNALAEGADNVFYSPFSIAIALSMTLAGSKANTRAQLAEFLGTSQIDDISLGKSYNYLFNKFRGDKSLKWANMMYSSDRLAVNANFQTILRDMYQATAEAVDFVKNSEGVRTTINSDVAKHTNDLIKDLLAPGILNPMTSMVLVNAVYFKGDWKNQFNDSNTMDDEFTTLDGSKVQTPMMNGRKKVDLGYHDDIKARSISMDYENDFSMLIVLPNEDSSILEVEKALPKKGISALISEHFRTEVGLKIPKFKLEFEKNLKETLFKLGVTDLVTEGVADLSGIAGNPGDLSVSDVIHKAVVEVNEKGSEAAAATGIVIMTRSMPVMREQPFHADRPFMFYIYDRDTQVPIFGGRYASPATASSKTEL